MIRDMPLSGRSRRRRALLPAALLLAGLQVGCGSLGGLPHPLRSDAVCIEEGICEADALRAVIAYHVAIGELPSEELQQRQRGLADTADGALERMRQAIVLGHPRAPLDLPRAMSLLEAVLASHEDEAIALHAMARLLEAELQARRTLYTRLKENEQARAQLQHKLDALAEIERTLPARPSPDATLPEPEPEPADTGESP